MSCATIRFIGDLKTVFEDGWTTVYWDDGRVSTIIGEITPTKYMSEAQWYYHSDHKLSEAMYTHGFQLAQYFEVCHKYYLKPTKDGFEKFKVMEVLK